MNAIPPDANSQEVKVTILNKEYRVACPAGQKEKLTDAVNLLNQRMRETKDSNPSSDTAQTIAMTALNLSHDLLEQQREQQRQRQQSEQREQQRKTENNEVRERLQAIKECLDTQALQRRTQIGHPHQL